MQIYSANSHYIRKQYRKAEHIYRISLVARKSVGKTNTNMSYNLESLIELYPENEIRYKIGLCLEQMTELPDALSALNSIPHRQRNLKINMMIGKLSMLLGKCQNAEAAFKCVVRDSPLNLEAMKGLLTLGVPEIEVSGIISQSKYADFFLHRNSSFLQVFGLPF